MILSYAYRDAKGVYHGYGELEIGEGGAAKLKEGGEAIAPQVEKMSKSKKNVINPDEVIGKYGADAFRMYEMFMGPIDDSKPWDIHGIEGVSRFLRKAWTHLSDPSSWKDGEGLTSIRHRTIAKVTADIEAMRYNTAISALMVFLSAIVDGPIHREDAETFLHLLNPFAPHLTEELWEKTKHKGFLSTAPWPTHDPKLLVDKKAEIAIQINGKVRDRFEVDLAWPDDKVIAAALGQPKIKEAVDGKTLAKSVYIKGRLVNLVIG